MIKYITNDTLFIRSADRCLFNFSMALYRRLGEPTHVKIYKTEDEYYIKIKACDSDDLNGNVVNSYDRVDGDGYAYRCNGMMSSIELSSMIGNDHGERIYAYGTDGHGGIIMRVWETEDEPSKFQILKKETKMFLASGGSHEDLHRIRMSMEAFRRLNVPKNVALWVDKKRQRLYIARASERVGSYPVRFTKTSPNSGFVTFNALNLKDELRVDIGKRFKLEMKQDMSGKYYVDIGGKILPRNSKGIVKCNS